MSDDLVKRLRETTHMYQVDCELKMKCADRIEELEAKLAVAVELVERAFNEGVGEGMNDVLRQSGGKTWYDSRSRKRLAELTGGPKNGNE